LTTGDARGFEGGEESLREIKQLELEAYAEVAALERPDAMFKKPPGTSTLANSIFSSPATHARGRHGVELRSDRPHFPAGTNLFFLYPPVCTCSATVAPASRDQDRRFS
jgi:hypothetical protein